MNKKLDGKIEEYFYTGSLKLGMRYAQIQQQRIEETMSKTEDILLFACIDLFYKFITD